MQELATISIDDRPLLDARQLWWRAELLKQWDAQRQTIAPIERAEPVQVTIGVAGVLVLLAWLWRSVPASTDMLTFATVLSVALLVAVALLTLAGLIVEGSATDAFH